MKNVIWQSLVNINVYAKDYQNVPLSSREGYFHFFRIWTSATPLPIPNDIWRSLGLHLVNINAYAKFYQNIPNGLRVIDIFYEQAGDKIFTNSPRTKSSQTVRWQNHIFDYKAFYEIQLQVSVDFLRVVYSLGIGCVSIWCASGCGGFYSGRARSTEVFKLVFTLGAQVTRTGTYARTHTGKRTHLLLIAMTQKFSNSAY